MNFFKKLVFAPFLIISVVAVVVFADQILQDPLTAVIGFQASSFFTLAYLSISLVLTALFFALIVTLASSWEIPIFVAGGASIIPLLMIQKFPINAIFALGFFFSFIIGMILLLQKLKSYLTFSPKQLLTPTIGLMTLLFSLTISVAAYQDASTKIAKDGFTVPDQLINAAMNMSGVNSLANPSSLNLDTNVQGVSTSTANSPTTAAAPPPGLTLTPEMIKYVQQNPDLLKSFNVTPEQFNDYVKSQQQTNGTTQKKTTTSGKTATPTTQTTQPSSGSSAESPDLVTGLVKNQMNNAIKPYSSFIAPMIGILLFSTITFGNYILSFFTPLLLWIIFSIMESSGFVKFVKEMREVKKLVV